MTTELQSIDQEYSATANLTFHPNSWKTYKQLIVLFLNLLV